MTQPHEIEVGRQSFELSEGLYLIEADETQSRLYHDIKRQLPPGTPILVAALAGPPKFKGMASGAQTWLRSLDTD